MRSRFFKIVTIVITLFASIPVLATHFEAAFIEKEPCWAYHPDASLKCGHQDQRHPHGLIVFEKIHGVNEHLPLFVVRTRGTYKSIKERTYQLAEKMDLAMEMIDKGGELSTSKDGNNYAIYVEKGHSRLRILTVTSDDAIGYKQRSDPAYWNNLTAEDLAKYIIDYWLDMYYVFYRMEEPRYINNTEEGKQIIGMLKWSRMMAKNDGVKLTNETLHEYIDLMPGNAEFKKELESLAFKLPDVHGSGTHGYVPHEH